MWAHAAVDSCQSNQNLGFTVGNHLDTAYVVKTPPPHRKITCLRFPGHAPWKIQQKGRRWGRPFIDKFPPPPNPTMHSLLITALLCYGFYRHCCVHGRYTNPHLNSYYLPFMADANVSGLPLNRQYLVNTAVKLRCAWNTTTPSGLQDSLLLDMDYNTLTCQPGTVVKSPPGSAGTSTFSSLNATDLAAFGRNLAVTAYLQNGSSNYQFPLQFVGNATFSVPLNRSALGTDRYVAKPPPEWFFLHGLGTSPTNS